MSKRALTPEDLRWLVCPVCRRALQLEAKTIACVGCHRRYPIVGGIPVLLADRALEPTQG